MASNQTAARDPIGEPCPKCGHALSALPAAMTMAGTTAAPAYRCLFCGWLGDELDRRTEAPAAHPDAGARGGEES
jgi:hypothetical protein